VTAKIGIRREDKSQWERRVPLTPDQVKKLVAQGIEVVIQPSKIRAFSDARYQKAGASILEDLSDCSVVLAVKEIPSSLFRPNGSYMYFAHVIKGQAYNMPMLQKLLDLNCTLIDYERVVDENNRRLIFFGRHAGLAGMIDTLWALGQRLEHEGIKSPFESTLPAHKYKDLEEAKQAIEKVGREITQQGLPTEISPLVVGFAGYGNVSQGAQEIFDLLPHRVITPRQLVADDRQDSKNELVKVVFKEEDMVKRLDQSQPFNLQEYYNHPENYVGDFEKYLAHLSVLVNCIYWESKYPKLVTKDTITKLYSAETQPNLRIIGDISCDIEGGVECTIKCTDSSDPVFVFRAQADDQQAIFGVQGKGPVIMAVDNLPCELPVESSTDFGKALMPFVPELVNTDYSRPFEQLTLSEPIKAAVITHAGKLTPDYAYLEKHLK
jgi:alpha-aminoadipic semialdehyde synthase